MNDLPEPALKDDVLPSTNKAALTGALANSRQLKALSRRASELLARARSLPPEQMRDTRQWAREAAVWAREARNPLLEAEAWLVAASLAGPMAPPLDLLEPLRRAETIFSAHRDTRGVARSQLRQALILRDMGVEEQAADTAERALRTGSLDLLQQVLAHVCVASCKLRLGDFESFWHRLNGVAEPLARIANEAQALATVLWAQALAQLLMLAARDNPELWLEPPASAGLNLDRRASADTISAKLDEAESISGSTGFRQYLDLCRQTGLVLLNKDLAAARHLAEIAASAGECDVTLSLLAEFVLALFARSRGQLRLALSMFDQLRQRSERFGQASLVRDVTLQLSLVHESLNDPASALSHLKKHTKLVGLSLRLPPFGADAAVPPSQHRAPQPGPQADLHTLPPRTLEPAYLRRAVLFIHQRLAGPLDVGLVANHCGVSRRSLEVGFRNYRSTTVAGFISRHRMEHAARLLRKSSMRLDEVAAAVGYRSATAFARTFQVHYGSTPAAWRRAG